MKKGVLIGCAVVLLILVLGGAAAWFVVIRPMWNAGAELMEAGRQWVQIAELDARVQNTASFTEPAEGRLDAASVQRFVTVQGAIASALGEDWKALEQKYEDLKRSLDQEGREASLQEVFAAYGDLSGIVLTAKQAQVEALNASGMSLEEYRWLRAQAYAAAGLALGDETPQALAGSAAAHNAELLRPHRELLQRTLATAWLGF